MITNMSCKKQPAYDIYGFHAAATACALSPPSLSALCGDGGVLCYSPDGFSLMAVLEDQMLHSMRSIWLGMVCGCFVVGWAQNVA